MAFISEVHYQNGYAASSGVSEYVEVALTAAEFANAADYTIATYQLDGTVADSVSLDQLTPVYDASLDLYTYRFETAVTNPDHSPGGDTGAGEAEAVSLVNTATDEVISFFDIGGGSTGITASGGPADGATSVNIPAAGFGQTIQFDPYENRIDGEASVDQQPFVVLEFTGAQIGTYTSASSTGNGDDLVLTLDGAEALGDENEIYSLVVSQTGGFDYFNNGQLVSVVDSNGDPVFQNAGVNNDAFQGRGGGDPYLVLSNGYVIDLRGLPDTPTSVDYTLADDVIGDPYRTPYGELNFEDVSDPPPIPCFAAGTMISTFYGDRRVEDLKAAILC